MSKIQKFMKKQGFTLVELIIVIAIIAVLAVSAFMMLTKWLWKSRDSRRLWDLWTIKKALEITYSDTDNKINQYPDPTNGTGVTDGWWIPMWNLWVFGLETIEDMDNMQKAPQDPSDQSYYKYATTIDKREFQVWAILEDGEEVSILGNVMAGTSVAKLDGTYDGYVNYMSGTNKMIVRIPSLLLYSGTTIDTLSGSSEMFMVEGQWIWVPLVVRSVEMVPGITAWTISDKLGIAVLEAERFIPEDDGENQDCGEIEYDGYNITVLIHNETKEFEKISIPVNGKTKISATCSNAAISYWVETISCDTNYVNDENGNCVLGTCSGSKPANAVSNGTPWTASWAYSEIEGVCKYKCDIGYTYNPVANTCDLNTYTVSGSFGSNANGATINVCGTTVVANSLWDFSVTKNYWSNCSNINTARTDYVCTTTTNWPATLSSNISNIAGNCIVANNTITFAIWTTGRKCLINNKIWYYNYNPGSSICPTWYRLLDRNLTTTEIAYMKVLVNAAWGAGINVDAVKTDCTIHTTYASATNWFRCAIWASTVPTTLGAGNWSTWTVWTSGISCSGQIPTIEYWPAVCIK